MKRSPVVGMTGAGDWVAPELVKLAETLALAVAQHGYV